MKYAYLVFPSLEMHDLMVPFFCHVHMHLICWYYPQSRSVWSWYYVLGVIIPNDDGPRRDAGRNLCCKALWVSLSWEWHFYQTLRERFLWCSPIGFTLAVLELLAVWYIILLACTLSWCLTIGWYIFMKAIWLMKFRTSIDWHSQSVKYSPS